jgi:hypothetical protein
LERAVNLLTCCAHLLLLAPPPAPAETAGGWVKDPRSPVLGGQCGTCFDISVLREVVNERPRWRMWVSWRPKASLALVESDDGVTWTKHPGDPVFTPDCMLGWGVP